MAKLRGESAKFLNPSDNERDNLPRSSSIFLQFSFEEGLGLADKEAITIGLPVLHKKQRALMGMWIRKVMAFYYHKPMIL